MIKTYKLINNKYEHISTDIIFGATDNHVENDLLLDSDTKYGDDEYRYDDNLYTSQFKYTAPFGEYLVIIGPFKEFTKCSYHTKIHMNRLIRKGYFIPLEKHIRDLKIDIC